MTGNNIAYTRSVLGRAGGPDSRFRMGAEDRDLLLRVVRCGGNVHFDPTIVVDHYNDADFGRFLRHQYDQGKGSYLFYTVHNRLGTKIPPIPLSVYMGLLIEPFRHHRVGRASVLLWLIVLAQVAVAVGFVTAMLSGDDNVNAQADML